MLTAVQCDLKLIEPEILARMVLLDLIAKVAFGDQTRYLFYGQTAKKECRVDEFQGCHRSKLL